MPEKKRPARRTFGEIVDRKSKTTGKKDEEVSAPPASSQGAHYLASGRADDVRKQMTDPSDHSFGAVARNVSVAASMIQDMTDELTMIDLFAGAGGMTIGFEKVGFHSVMAVEWEKAAAATYQANRPEARVHAGDIAEVSDDEIPDHVDLIIGGPPCQGFSSLGLKDVNDPRNQLWREYMRFVVKARPYAFVMENVDRFSKAPEFEMLLNQSKQGTDKNRLLKDYELTVAVLDAADYGVAEHRRRTIVIGSRIGKIEMPVKTHGKVDPDQLDLDDIAAWKTVREALSGVPREVKGTDLPERVSEFLDDKGRPMPGPFVGKELHFGRNPVPKSLLRYSFIPPGGGRFDLPDDSDSGKPLSERIMPNCWAKKRTGTTDVMGRLRWDEPSVTIRTEFFKPEKGRYLHPQWVEAKKQTHGFEGKRQGEPSKTVNRVISHYEASLIQDFPEDYKWIGSKIQIARQIGNAVPSGLAAAIGEHVKPYIEEHKELDSIVVPEKVAA